MTLLQGISQDSNSCAVTPNIALLLYLHCRQALLANALLADVPFHSNIAHIYLPLMHMHTHT